MKQLDLFEWAEDQAYESRDCYCGILPIEDEKQICDTCQIAQLSDFNYVSNMLGAFGDEE